MVFKASPLTEGERALAPQFDQFHGPTAVWQSFANPFHQAATQSASLCCFIGHSSEVPRYEKISTQMGKLEKMVQV